MNLTEEQKKTKAKIKSHFEGVLENTKTEEEVERFYSEIRNIIIGMIRSDVLYEYYDFYGFKLYKEDIPLIKLVFEEYNLKMRMLGGLE